MEKMADQNKPESEYSVTTTVLDGTDVKKIHRSKRRCSVAAQSSEAPRQEPQSSVRMEPEASTIGIVPLELTSLMKDEMKPDETATKVSHKADSLVQAPEEKGSILAAAPRSEVVISAAPDKAEPDEAAVPTGPKEPDNIQAKQWVQDAKSSMQPSLRSTGFRESLKSSHFADNRRRLFVAAVLSVFILNAMAVLWLLMSAWDSEDTYVMVPLLGAFRGLRTMVENQPVYMFRGIPFARSTEGMLRFADASVISAINTTDIDARIPKAGCAQKSYKLHGQVIRSNEGTTEDCLHLNVWTPCTDSTTPGCRKTVLMFFHAIEFQNGDNNYYDGRWIAGLGQVVVVAPNFRLGAFGFLNIGCLLSDMPCIPDDEGLGDQRAAMQWVLNHIASFGGNTSDVVLMGSGSGAWSVGAHLLKDGMGGPRFWSHERFSKVILLSESPFRRYFDDKSHELPSLLKCSIGGTVEMLHCMRTVPSREIIRATSEVVHYFGPSASAHPGVHDASGVTGRRFLLGTVSNEGTHLLDYLLRTSPPNADMEYVVRTFLDMIYHITNASEVVDAFQNVIMPSENVTGLSWAYELLGDLFYTCPLLRLGRELSTQARNLVFGYVFDYQATFALFNDTTGAARFSDLDFMFGRPLDGSQVANAQEKDLSRRMIDMLSTFATTG
nr:acetylcholinesterase-like [Rhipicephalus microplus]